MKIISLFRYLQFALLLASYTLLAMPSSPAESPQAPHVQAKKTPSPADIVEDPTQYPPVPEPAAWMTAMIGFSVLLLTMRFRPRMR